MAARFLSALVVVAGLLLPGGAQASSAAPEIPRLKLDTIMLEMWDDQNLFHQVILELVVFFPEAPKMAKKAVAIEIQRALQALPYAELAKPGAAELIKTTAMGIVRAQPGGQTAKEVLINKFLAR
jgi:hypothetical protein